MPEYTDTDEELAMARAYIADLQTKLAAAEAERDEVRRIAVETVTRHQAKLAKATAVVEQARRTHEATVFIPGDPDAFYMEDALLGEALAALDSPHTGPADE